MQVVYHVRALERHGQRIVQPSAVLWCCVMIKMTAGEEGWPDMAWSRVFFYREPKWVQSLIPDVTEIFSCVLGIDMWRNFTFGHTRKWKKTFFIALSLSSCVFFLEIAKLNWNRVCEYPDHWWCLRIQIFETWVSRSLITEYPDLYSTWVSSSL